MTIKEIFETFAPEYITLFEDAMPSEHRKVIEAIISCRTETCGLIVYECEKCHQKHIVFRSCGNRHCPNCQHHKASQWLEKQLKRQLPGHHFMITFTVPEQLRRFIRSNQRDCYGAMFSASSATLKKLSADQKYVGGDCPGFFGVLHTWGRQLHYHPHIHYIVPGGAYSKTDGKWHSSRVDFFLPVKAISKIFRAKFRDAMKKAGLLSEIPSEVWMIDWNVNSQAVGHNSSGVKYLAPYVFKVAISDKRIVKVEDHKVYFRYKKPGGHRWHVMALDVIEFIRRFLQHVLPTGFMKIRYYGFLSPGCSVSLEKIRLLIELFYEFDIVEMKAKPSPIKPMNCPDCGGVLKYICSVLPFEMPFYASG
jgi:hypothetical protein